MRFGQYWPPAEVGGSPAGGETRVFICWLPQDALAISVGEWVVSEVGTIETAFDWWTARDAGDSGDRAAAIVVAWEGGRVVPVQVRSTKPWGTLDGGLGHLWGWDRVVEKVRGVLGVEVPPDEPTAVEAAPAGPPPQVTVNDDQSITVRSYGRATVDNIMERIAVNLPEMLMAHGRPIEVAPGVTVTIHGLTDADDERLFRLGSVAWEWSPVNTRTTEERRHTVLPASDKYRFVNLPRPRTASYVAGLNAVSAADYAEKIKQRLNEPAAPSWTRERQAQAERDHPGLDAADAADAARQGGEG